LLGTKKDIPTIKEALKKKQITGEIGGYITAELAKPDAKRAIRRLDPGGRTINFDS
jgi:hypothetical protein